MTTVEATEPHKLSPPSKAEEMEKAAKEIFDEFSSLEISCAWGIPRGAVASLDFPESELVIWIHYPSMISMDDLRQIQERAQELALKRRVTFEFEANDPNDFDDLVLRVSKGVDPEKVREEAQKQKNLRT